MLEFGVEQTITHKGRAYRVGRLTLEVLEQFFEWVRAQVGDPFAVVDRYLDRLDPKDALALVREAKAVKDALDGMDLGSPLFIEWVSKTCGCSRLLHLMLLRNHPEVTPGLAFEVVVGMGQAEAKKLIKKGAGSVPGGNADGPAAAADAPGLPTGSTSSAASATT